MMNFLIIAKFKKKTLQIIYRLKKKNIEKCTFLIEIDSDRKGYNVDLMLRPPCRAFFLTIKGRGIKSAFFVVN